MNKFEQIFRKSDLISLGFDSASTLVADKIPKKQNSDQDLIEGKYVLLSEDMIFQFLRIRPNHVALVSRTPEKMPAAKVKPVLFCAFARSCLSCGWLHALAAKHALVDKRYRACFSIPKRSPSTFAVVRMGFKQMLAVASVVHLLNRNGWG